MSDECEIVQTIFMVQVEGESIKKKSVPKKEAGLQSCYCIKMKIRKLDNKIPKKTQGQCFSATQNCLKHIDTGLRLTQDEQLMRQRSASFI